MSFSRYPFDYSSYSQINRLILTGNLTGQIEIYIAQDSRCQDCVTNRAISSLRKVNCNDDKLVVMV